MKEIHKKVKELKNKALEIIENKLNGELTASDMQLLCRSINEIDDDKNWIMEQLANGFNSGLASSNFQIRNDNKLN